MPWRQVWTLILKNCTVLPWLQFVSKGQLHAERKADQIVMTGVVTHGLSDL